MKSASKYLAMALLGALTAALGSCSQALYSSKNTVSDDLYATHDKKAITEVKQRQAEIELADAKAREIQIRAAIAQAEADGRLVEYDGEYESGNPYQDILADDYETAYQRRLKGFESPTYKMPSSYFDARYGDKSTYASAYDPSFYNVMVMGDQVWVEPKYITSMFGNWGSPVNINFGFGGYWGDPYWNWGLHRPSWAFGWGYPYYGGGWYDPWYNPWWGHYPHYGHHYPSWGTRPNVSYRPNYGSYPGRPSTSTTHRPNSSNSYNTNRGTSTTYRRGTSTSTTNRDKTTPTYERNDNTTRPTYERPSNTGGYSRGTSSGGSSSGGSSSGGSSRGGGYSGGSYNRR